MCLKRAVLISCFDWFDTRLKPIKEVLDSEYEVYCYISDFVHTSKQYISDKKPECIYIHIPPYKKNISFARIKSSLVFGRKIGHILEDVQPDLVYLLIPPNNTARYCAKYKHKHPNILYYLDLIDLWPESFPIDNRIKKSIAFKYWQQLRNDSIEIADHVFTECNLYVDHLNDELNQNKVTTLYLFRNENPGLMNEVEKCIQHKAHKKRDSISICYLGSINHLIDIDVICGLIKGLINAGKEVELKVIGVGESKDLLLSQAGKAGAEIIYYGSVYDQNEKLKLIGTCDFGLNIMKSNVVVGLTIKSVDYLSMGIPIINNIRGDTWSLVDEERIGINLTDNLEINALRIINADFVKMSLNAQKVFTEQFTITAFKKRFISGISSTL